MRQNPSSNRVGGDPLAVRGNRGGAAGAAAGATQPAGGAAVVERHARTRRPRATRRRARRRARARRPARDRQLADAYGELAQILHVYETLRWRRGRVPQRGPPVDPGRCGGRICSGTCWRRSAGSTKRRRSSSASFVSVPGIARPPPISPTSTCAAAGWRWRASSSRRSPRRFPRSPVTASVKWRCAQDRFDEAVGRFQSVLERFPTATAAHYSLAMAYRGLGRLDDARRHLALRGTGTVRVSDSVVDHLQTLVRGERGLVLQGRQLHEAGQFAEAADAFRRAIAAAPTSATAHVNLGMALVQLGDTAAAIAAFRDAVAAAPDDVAAQASLGCPARGHEPAGRSGPAPVGRLRPRAGRRRHSHAAACERCCASAAPTKQSAVLAARDVAAPDDEQIVVELAILLADRMRYREAIARSGRRLPAPPGSRGDGDDARPSAGSRARSRPARRPACARDRHRRACDRGHPCALRDRRPRARGTRTLQRGSGLDAKSDRRGAPHETRSSTPCGWRVSCRNTTGTNAGRRPRIACQPESD